MGYVKAVALEADFQPFLVLQEQYGYVPNLFLAQTLLPQAIATEVELIRAVILKQQALTRIQKERILLLLAVSLRNEYCVALHTATLQILGMKEAQIKQIIADYRGLTLPENEIALLAFAFKLGQSRSRLRRADIAALTALGWTDEATLEAIATVALGKFLCTLATGLGVEPDFDVPPMPPQIHPPKPPLPPDKEKGPHLRTVPLDAGNFPSFAHVHNQYGFIPNIFEAQTLRPDIVEAEAAILKALLFTEDLLQPFQKHCILLVTSAANADGYHLALHSLLLRGKGVAVPESMEIALKHQNSELSEGDKALLDFALKLTRSPADLAQNHVDALGKHGFAEAQILEGAVLCSLGAFLSTLQAGLGVEPDSPWISTPLEDTPEEIPHLLPAESRPTSESTTDKAMDPDAETVHRVRSGDVEAFEVLIHQHGQRVYRTLISILGNPDDARDCMQDTFLKAFQSLGSFEGRSKFSTWLVTIASNGALQRLRERRPMESLDEADDEGFRPRQVRAWSDTPEQLYSKSERKKLVESAIRALPVKYRVVLVLRDIQQMPTEEAAQVLGLSIPALKARLLRGRLMLREALAPHFSGGVAGVAS